MNKEVIEYGRVTKENRRLFSDLAPKKILDLLSSDRCFMITAIVEGIPAGLICFFAASTKQKTSFSIRWLYVLPEYRRQGIASALIDYTKGMAARIGVSDIALSFPQEYGDETLEEFVNSAISVSSMEEEKLFSHSIFSMRKNSKLEMYREKSGVCDLTKVSAHSFEKFIRSLPKDVEESVPAELICDIARIDRSLSSAFILDNGDIGAALIVRVDENGSIRPLLLLNKVASDPMLPIKLIEFSFRAACIDYSSDTLIRFLCTKDITKQIMGHFFPKLGLNDYYEVRINTNEGD